MIVNKKKSRGEQRLFLLCTYCGCVCCDVGEVSCRKKIMKDNISVIGCTHKVKGICVLVPLWLLYGLVWVCYDKYLFLPSER